MRDPTGPATPPAVRCADGGPRHAGAARTVADRILDRLADVRTVAATAVPASTTGTRPVRRPVSGVHAGVSMALNVASRDGADRTARAHAHLAAAALALTGERAGHGLLGGAGLTGLAMVIAHRVTGGYRSALQHLDGHLRRQVRAILPVPGERPLATNAEFEVVRGLAGTGRLLLARRETCEAELTGVLGYLVAMSHGTVALGAHRVPRWWTYAAPSPGAGSTPPDGHLNLGLSHGVAGPLALLSLATSAGIEVDGQRDAIENLMALLAAVARTDGRAVRWPRTMTLADWTAGAGVAYDRFSWCYGVPGVARAVQLAALALDRPDWHDLVHRSLLPVLDTSPETWDVPDAGICHGWAGLAHLLGRLGEHVDDARLTDRRDALAARTVAAYDERYRFGFTGRWDGPDGTDASFLGGAAGIALALDAYATGTVTGSWDLALLVS